MVEVEENLLTEEDFKSNIQNILADLPHGQEKWTAYSVPQVNRVTIFWKSENPAPSPLTTYEQAVIA